MRVRDVMTSPAHVINPDTPAWEAIGVMRRLRIRRLPVVEHHALVGIVTWTDLVRIRPPAIGGRWPMPNLTAGVFVRHLMTPAPITVGPDATIEEAAAVMRRRKIGGLPVVDGDHLLGMITESDLFDVFVDAMAAGPDEVRVHVPVSTVATELPVIVASLTQTGIPILALHTLRRQKREAVDIVVRERDLRRAQEVFQRRGLAIEQPAPAGLAVQG